VTQIGYSLMFISH